MSGSRKLKLRAGPRAPRRSAHTNKHAEPVPLANRFQELIEQDEAAAPSPSQSRVVDHHGPTTATTSMAQRLQDMLGESSPFGNNVVQGKRNVAAGFAARRESEPLWNDEVEAVESDTSDLEEGTRGSVKGVVPMGQRLDELLQEDKSRSRQEKPKQRQKGKRPLLEPKKAVSNSDDIEACDIAGTPTYPDDVHVPTPTKPQPLPRIAEQFQEALMAAPSFEFTPSPSLQQFPTKQDYSTRLQRILQAEKLQHAEIAKGPPGGAPLDSIQVQITKKSLEGRLVTCKCQVMQAPLKWTSSSPHVDQVHVIFNSKTAAELEIDVGRMVRINSPWREVTLVGSTTRVILCTYFCEAVY